MSEYYVFENISPYDEGDGGFFLTNAPKKILLKAYRFADYWFNKPEAMSCWEDDLHYWLNKRGYTIEKFEPEFILHSGSEV